jgi:CarD family transcriptional regulator
MMTFVIGDKVVYPNQGIATIENISTRSFGNQFERFYLLRLMYTSMTVMVPFSNAASVGLRRVTKGAEVNKVLTFLAGGLCECSADWKVRFKENSDKMQNGSMLEVAQVLKSLLRLQLDKPLSFREKKMLDRARHLLVSEVSIARSVKAAEAESLLDKALQKAGLSLPDSL